MSATTTVPRVVPAQLSFLAIYNPALGDSDETFHRQVVFYYAKAARARAKLPKGHAQADQALAEEENEKLRQVGLAQGMVGFARSFSNGEPVDSIETDRSRIVMHQLEHGWWVLASIDLTQLPAPAASKDAAAPAVEYSSREVSPPALLVQQLVRAHAVFTLHHGWPLEQLLLKHGRDKFCSILSTYWSRFAAHWDVLLHASPAVDMFNSLKLAAGGELGMGVGEEDWGSSERDVLEDFARRTEGLVDVVVARYGAASPLQDKKAKVEARPSDSPAEPWLGSGGSVAAADGVVFSGVGGLTRASLRDVSHWMETVYHYGDHAYGIRDNPTADRRRQRKRRNLHAPPRPAEPSPAKPTHDKPLEDKSQPHDSGTGEAPRIPPPIVKAVESSLDRASQAVDAKGANKTDAAPSEPEPPRMLASLGDTETWIKYMTLGYGTAWGASKPEPAPAPPPETPRQEPEAMRYVEPAPDVDLVEEKRRAQCRAENDGYFLIGLKGDMDDEDDEDNWNARIPLRTVYVEQITRGSSISESDETPGDDATESAFHMLPKLEKSRLRPVVYVHRPFVYTFLFAHRTSSLSMPSFYRSLHSFFAPLHRSLDRNTAPSRVAQRLLAAQTLQTTTATTAALGPNTTPIHSLVWDPRTLTLHSSIPNIPDPGTLLAEGLSSKDTGGEDAWSRLDALNVHSAMLATLSSTRHSLSEIERTCKTSRGWWVAWMRLPPSQPSPSSPPPPSSTDADADQQTSHSSPRPDSPSSSATTTQAFNTDELRQAFLVRRARDALPPAPKSAGSRLASGVWSGIGMGGGSSTAQQQRTGGRAAGWGPKGLAEGIGIDARRYVDELLSLNR